MSVSKCWEEISKSTLTDDEIELLHEHVNWNDVSRYAKLRHETWMKFERRINRIQIQYNPHVKAETFLALKHHISWVKLEVERPMDDEFLLAVLEQIHTVTFAHKNPSAKNIKPETWDEVIARNTEEFRMSRGATRRTDFIETQLLSVAALSEQSDKWSDENWQTISVYQRIDAAFVKQYWQKLDTKDIKTKNMIHTITEGEFDEIAEMISQEIDTFIKEDERRERVVDKIAKPHLLSDWFIEKYKVEK